MLFPGFDSRIHAVLKFSSRGLQRETVVSTIFVSQIESDGLSAPLLGGKRAYDLR